MTKVAIFLLAITLSKTSSAGIDPHPLSDEFIDSINRQQSSWTAGRNFHDKTSISKLRSLLGALDLPPHKKPKWNVQRHDTNVTIPESFDARKYWPHCQLIGLIRDQSACGSDWAVSVASVITDRLCIASNGTRQDYVSDQDLLSCCNDCGDCDGGYSERAYYYWLQYGLCTGGPYNTTMGCKAYDFPPCDHNLNGRRWNCSLFCFYKPECKDNCDNPVVHCEDDIVEAAWVRQLENDPVQMQLEILKNGPLHSEFLVYSDFYNYRKGVYRKSAGNYKGTHGVRILGWGVEDGTPYWLAANSWNDDWGDDGLFKILRGSDECLIESNILIAMPKV